MAPDETAPPETERRPVTEELHGEELVDPYRWLEEDTEAVQAWVDRQNEYADDFLDGEVRETLRPRFEDLAEISDYQPVQVRGGVYFQRIEAPDEDQPVLYVRESLDEERRVLVDPNEFPEGQSMDWYVPSLDGDLVAYGVAEGGTEQYDVRVIDLEGAQVDAVEDVGRTGGWSFAWTPDGFYYMHTGSAAEGTQLDKGIRYHELGTDPAEDREIDVDLGQRQWPQVDAAEDGTLVVAVEEMSIRTDLYVLPAGEDDLQPVLTGEDATFFPTVHEGVVYLRTTLDAENRRVLSAPVDRFAEGEMAPDEFDVPIPEDDDAILHNAVPAGDYLVGHHHRDVRSELSVWDPGAGERIRSVDVDGPATVQALSGSDESPEAFYRVTSFERPPSVVRVDADTGETTELDRPDVDVGVDLTVTQEWFESDDGTEIPAFLVHREGLDLDGSNPAIVYGYGGFRNSLTPQFRRYLLPYLEAGGVYAWAALRGGNEFGESWHRAGMREHKQNVFDDFYAVAEGVVDRDYADPDRLAAKGASNGGLLVGAAITQRPDLWRAAVAGVPLMDMLRFHRFLLGEAWTNEYGSPEDPEAFEWLQAYSPYHNVEKRAYPATMIHTAAGDTRVHPAHARKTTARLQANQTGADPILLRTESATGHGVGTPTSIAVEQQLDYWSFLLDQLDVDV